MYIVLIFFSVKLLWTQNVFIFQRILFKKSTIHSGLIILKCFNIFHTYFLYPLPILLLYTLTKVLLDHWCLCVYVCSLVATGKWKRTVNHPLLPHLPWPHRLLHGLLGAEQICPGKPLNRETAYFFWAKNMEFFPQNNIVFVLYTYIFFIFIIVHI